MERPTTVTVAAWIIIVMAADAIAGSLSSLVRPILSQLAGNSAIGVSVAMVVGSLIQIAMCVAAVFMLRGLSGARIGFAVLSGFVIVGLLVSWAQNPAMASIAVYTIIKTAILLVVLFRPEANAYFSGAGGSAKGDSPSATGQTGT